MARYVETKITLTANQAAGKDPILDAETASIPVRQAVVIGNPGTSDANLHLATGATSGTGLPLPGGQLIAFSHALPGLDNELYVTGLAAGDKLTIWVA